MKAEEKILSINLSTHYFTAISILTAMAYFFGLGIGKPGIFEMVPLTVSDYFVYFCKLIQAFVPIIIFLFISLAYKLMFTDIVNNKIASSEKDLRISSILDRLGFVLSYLFGIFFIIFGFISSNIIFIIAGLTLTNLLPVYKITTRLILEKHLILKKSSRMAGIILFFSLQIIILGFIWETANATISQGGNYELVFADGKIFRPKKILSFSQGVLIDVESTNKFIPWSEIASIAKQTDRHS